MPDKPEKHDLHIDLYIDFKEDLTRLRQLMNKADELRDLIPEWNQMESRRIYDEMLDIMDKCIRARRDRDARSAQNSQSEDGKPGTG